MDGDGELGEESPCRHPVFSCPRDAHVQEAEANMNPAIEANIDLKSLALQK